MRCTACATELIPGKKFCHACGVPTGRACTSCGARLDPQFRFCPDCGVPLAANDSAREQPGERKWVTVLFCDLAESTAAAERLDAEEYRELLDRYLELSFKEIDRFEGTVNQLAGDGFMALFGAPVAHEDAPERALRAALAIQEALLGFALRPRIGVHTGMVVVGNVGNDLKTDYTAIGDTTNLASRLESLAEPGTVLSSEATQRLVRGCFRMERKGPFEVRGKSEPVTAYEVLAFSDTPVETHTLTPFVGRTQELAHLQAAFERVSSNLPQVVALVGAAGSGKSRLVHEFRTWLAERPVELFAARCASLSRGVPYALWVDMMRRYFEIGAGEASEPALEKLRARLALVAGEEAEALLPGFRKILSLAGSEENAHEFEAVDRLVCRASRDTPVVMIVEDLHWIDDASREALELAIAGFGAERCMMLVTHRPEFEAHWQSAAVTQLQLRPLPDGEGVEIVRALAGGTLPTELETRILRQGVGNPFFLEELTRGLLEDGTLARRDGAVDVTRPVHEIRIPDSIQELLGARLDRLDPRAKRVAQL
ncbi:MAG: AAA family ATPase, partial [Deltaproteobacteria bacterium]|nr:AAA family ATPase [Deltaproteobacteria bacterium]